MTESTTPPSLTPYYVTTPIYYVNDRPHIGHCYTTLIADVIARAQRLLGRDVFFLTGTDEHAEKVVKSAAEHGFSPMDWATKNADRFKDAFAFMNFTNDDFVRTTEDRHKSRAQHYIQQLVDQGDIELGDYEGWYDPSQEEYVTDTTAKEHDFNSPVTGKPLEKRTEQNYFFRLDKHEAWLKQAIEANHVRVLPEARKNEVLGRIKHGLNKVPVSRRIKEDDADWGVVMPNDPDHRVYVWIEALCNYRTMIDQPDRGRYWTADEPGGPVVHTMAKDILWFHAVIWPAMLHALGVRPPAIVYAHAYWIAEGRKMSKSLGNFIEIDLLEAYAERYSLDAVRWFLTTQGPLGANDADFAHARFVEVYNADLANSFGNSTSRVSNMIAKYFEGAVQAADPFAQHHAAPTLPGAAAAALDAFQADLQNINLDRALAAGVGLVDAVDKAINDIRPFALAKEQAQLPLVGGFLYHCAEALRTASLLLHPAMPEKTAELWRRWNCDHLTDPADPNSPFKAPLAELARWAGPFSLKPGQHIEKGDPLFMRADAADPPPHA